MLENRKSARFNAKGWARVEGVQKVEISEKNISVTGCCLESAVSPEKFKINENYKLSIKPERASRAGAFDIEVKCMWVRKESSFCEFGFHIIASPSGKQFQNYVNYLSYRSNEAG
jgi:hypothetical protein